MFTTPSGIPASISSSPRTSTLSDDSTDGLSTTVLPVQRIAESFWLADTAGPFQGMISATTPTGSGPREVEGASAGTGTDPPGGTGAFAPTGVPLEQYGG